MVHGGLAHYPRTNAAYGFTQDDQSTLASVLHVSSTLIISLAAFGPSAISPIVLKPIKILGDAALGVAMIVIGGNLSLSHLRRSNPVHMAGVVMIKLILLPTVALIVLYILKLNPLISFVAMIQACMPSSITISLISRNYDTKDQHFINQGIFATHCLSMITIPIFLGLYGKLFN